MIRRLPTERAIRANWCDRLYSKKGFDSPQEFMEPGNCFACGWSWPLHRAHILAKCDGGSDECENLHMLCDVCHQDSEYLSGDKYWNWFYERSAFDASFSAAIRCGINPTKLIKDGSLVGARPPTIKERTQKRLLELRRDGRRYGQVPWGFSEDGGSLAPNQSEQAMVDQARHLRSQGLTLRGIAETLEGQGYRNRFGRPFNPNTIRKIVA